MKFDRESYNIILVHVARTWERLRLEQPNKEMTLDNIQSAEELPSVADFIIDTELMQEFLTNRNGDIWNRYQDGCSDIYIERIATEYINRYYI